jgi:hypothetical protein
MDMSSSPPTCRDSYANAFDSVVYTFYLIFPVYSAHFQFTVPYPIITNLILSYLTLPYFILPYLTLPYLILPYLTLPYLTLPYLTLPYLNH